jgi:uncharacterized protein YlxP (DUF503 family)
MRVGVLTIELAILEAQSLKDKRRVLKGTKERIRRAFNVSVAEVGYNDAPRRCRLGVAMVANESRVVQSQLDQVVDLVRRVGGVILVDYHSEVF